MMEMEEERLRMREHVMKNVSYLVSGLLQIRWVSLIKISDESLLVIPGNPGL